MPDRSSTQGVTSWKQLLSGSENVAIVMFAYSPGVQGSATTAAPQPALRMSSPGRPPAASHASSYRIFASCHSAAGRCRMTFGTGSS